jgi:hypothetical protein
MKIAAIWAAVLLAPIACKGVATVQLNNRDPDRPVYYLKIGELVPAAGTFVEVLGGPIGGVLIPIANLDGSGTVFRCSEPGYFNAGVGVIPGISDLGPAEFVVRVWRDEPSYDLAGQRGTSLHWTQLTGSWNPGDPAVTAPPLNIPASFGIYLIPEPSSIALALVGLTAWRLCAGVQRRPPPHPSDSNCR